ncbi:sulfite exporter TauE/SafE family protein [Shewanella maritima]|uniref:Sulfite exporter TauE/SafE family protein n=1 Tax=Shewanella maritima TaxID=2520507 RepID=A0A411PI50_9GAMM|nr:aromatic aminobenezylarsenical efflux permease ArsG family transporter [Shewanella maritima]QBF83269.1 sulfite exporter TauE/SafE family protein [Shewanella maritima]
MAEWFIVLSSALWFGVLTSISPCPLASNIAAVSFLSKQVDTPAQSISMGLFYCVGRMLSYILLAALLLYTATSAPRLSSFLQTQMNVIIGPILIVVGGCLLGWISLPTSNWSISHRLQKSLAGQGKLGALSLGSLFALSFCPTSAALFFASLLPLIIAQQSSLLIPSIYGFGTAIPVLMVALLLQFGSLKVASFYQKVTQVEMLARMASGGVFLLAGGFYCWLYIVPMLLG